MKMNAASEAFKEDHKLPRDEWLNGGEWTFCMHLKFWLDMIPLTATWYDGNDYKYPKGAFSQTIMMALPNNAKYADEMPLLDKDTNLVKQG